jgi:L-alanine-DL-glutamate epimerase-like enolase superfamily enzyme
MSLKLSWEPLDLHTRHAFHIARASAPPVRRNVWVRLTDGDGCEGWGEAAPSPYYGESADTVVAVLPSYSAALEDATDAARLEDIERALVRGIGRNAAARAAISSALHDLFGKRLGAPLWRLWGLAPSAPRSSFTIGLDEPALMRERVLAAAAAYPILKIKVGTDRDEEILRLVRDAAPSARIRLDANTGWTPKQALRHLGLLAELGIELIEQPLQPQDLDGHRLIRERSTIPIIADESCRTADDIPRLAGCFDGINIKLAKCGSLREALRMVHVARAHDMLVMLGCMVESTLAIAAAIQLAPLCDFVDLDGAALLADDPFTGPGLEPDGTLRFNENPGLGVTTTFQHREHRGH